LQINSRYEFYETIEFEDKFFSPTADKELAQKYKLYSVLVHSGAPQGGHYYAYIRPDGEQWLKFDDETVTKVTDREAIMDQFGEDSTNNGTRAARALLHLILGSLLSCLLSVYIISEGAYNGPLVSRCDAATRRNSDG
jgi:hypothetical protein